LPEGPDYSGLTRLQNPNENPPCRQGLNTLERRDGVNEHKRTGAYVFSEPMIQILNRLGAEQDKKFGLAAECTSKPQVKTLAYVVLSPIEFPGDKQHPTKGTWKIRYQFERCAEAKVYNAVFFANSNGDPPKSNAFFPGSSRADPLLIKDAMVAAHTGALLRSANKTCKESEIFDMQVSEPPHEVHEGGNTFKGVWSEVWTVRWCGENINVPINFVPDPDGHGVTFHSAPPS
jgi:hypothetical protein